MTYHDVPSSLVGAEKGKTDSQLNLLPLNISAVCCVNNLIFGLLIRVLDPAFFKVALDVYMSVDKSWILLHPMASEASKTTVG